MAIEIERTKYSPEDLYEAYKQQYFKSLKQLKGYGPKQEMYKKDEFIQDFNAYKRYYKGMSGVRVAEKMARSDVYYYTKAQSELIYGTLKKENKDELEDLQFRINNLRNELKQSRRKKDKEVIQASIDKLQSEQKILDKERRAYLSNLKKGSLGDADKESLDDLWKAIEADRKSMFAEGKSKREVRDEITKRYFGWKYV